MRKKFRILKPHLNAPIPVQTIPTPIAFSANSNCMSLGPDLKGVLDSLTHVIADLSIS